MLLPVIHIHVDIHQFTFVPPKGENITLKTIVHVIEEKDKWKYLAIGIDTLENMPSEAIAIGLFDDRHASSQYKIDKLSLLQGFMEYGISSCFVHAFLPVLRPRVIFHGIDRLRNVLHGYEQGVLRISAETIARDVRFE